VYGAGLLWAYKTDRVFHVPELTPAGECEVMEASELSAIETGFPEDV
jgi:hypothetical protein